MKVVLAGAFGHLGQDVLRALVSAGHEVVAADLTVRAVDGLDATAYKAKEINMTDPSTLLGLCDDADVVITTVGLTSANPHVSHYDVDYGANKNLLDEAKRAGVKNFAYVSVLKADKAPDIPMLDAKAKFEKELQGSGLQWVIFRPTGYFYDIVKVFAPMIEKGSVSLLKTKQPVRCNVVDTPDFARFIVQHMCDDDKMYNVGGKETYTYEELAKLCFAAAGKEPVIKFAPPFLFNILAWVNKLKKNGKEAIIKFSKWTLTEDMCGDTEVGDASFAAYIQNYFKK